MLRLGPTFTDPGLEFGFGKRESVPQRVRPTLVASILFALAAFQARQPATTA
jgi:hypothetical protein